MQVKRQLRNKPKITQQIDPEENENNQEQNNPQKILTNDDSKVQISSAQAELYFDYLRKKISHQTNDPFSLPFLNLKFEQLDSWKGVTEQLNLESRIYGMRVDNCHDNTMKLLNHVILNQQQQIGKNVSEIQEQVKKDGSNNNNHQSRSEANFYLEKAQKLVGKIDFDNKLQNRSFWKIIFKKSQTLSQIQLNTLQLSKILALEIDQKCINYRPYKKITQNSQNVKQIYQMEEDIFQKYPLIYKQFQILNEVQVTIKQINQEIQQIVQKRKNNPVIFQIQNPMWEANLGIRDLDLEDFYYQEYNQFERNNLELSPDKHNQIFDQNFQQKTRQQIFTPKTRQLRTFPMQELNQSDNQYEYVLQDEEFQNDLYQPQKDIWFNSTIKKYKPSKRIDGRKFGKLRKQNKTIVNFDRLEIFQDRNKALKRNKNSNKKFKNHNLVPINYVVVYENRNPFKKFKKVKNSGKINMYETHNNYRCMEIEDVPKLNDDYMQDTMLSQQNLNNNLSQFQNTQVLKQGDPQEVHQVMNFYKQVPMKTVKNEIMKQLKNCDQSMTLSKSILMSESLEQFQNNDQTSIMQTYLQQEAHLVGLKLLREKMGSYDPLDILVSMLHVAYQEQVRLQPIYFPNNQNDNGGDVQLLHDIIIQGDHFM